MNLKMSFIILNDISLQRFFTKTPDILILKLLCKKQICTWKPMGCAILRLEKPQCTREHVLLYTVLQNQNSGKFSGHSIVLSSAHVGTFGMGLYVIEDKIGAN